MVFSSSSQVIIIAPILPFIGETLHIPSALQGTLILAYAATLSVFALIVGPISDKIGRRQVMLLGSSFMSIALLLHGMADSFLVLLALRAAAGAAGGLLSGAAVAYVGDYFPYERRGWANGWVMSGMAFGQVVGVSIGTYLADVLGFRWPFLMFGISMGLAAILIWAVVPQPSVRLDEERLSIRGALSRYFGLLQRPEIATITLVYFLMFFSLGLYVTYLPTWLEQALHITGAQTAVLFGVGGISAVLVGPLAGRMSDRTGRKPLIVASCTGLGLVMLLTTYLIGSVMIAYVLFAVAMAMVSMRVSPFHSLISSLVDGDRRGVLMSLSVSMGQIGFGIGGGLAGLVYAHYGFYSITLGGAATIMVMAYIVHQHVIEPEFDTRLRVEGLEVEGLKVEG